MDGMDHAQQRIPATQQQINHKQQLSGLPTMFFFFRNNAKKLKDVKGPRAERFCYSLLLHFSLLPLDALLHARVSFWRKKTQAHPFTHLCIRREMNKVEIEPILTNR